MPGASVELIGAEKVRRRLDKLVRAGQDAAPLMRDIGEHVLTSTRDRFDSQTAPDGTPWEPLSDDTKRRKQRNKDKILTLDGDLRGNLAYRAGRDSVEIGSPSVYAGTHQFGALQGAPSARPRETGRFRGATSPIARSSACPTRTAPKSRNWRSCAIPTASRSPKTLRGSFLGRNSSATTCLRPESRANPQVRRTSRLRTAFERA